MGVILSVVLEVLLGAVGGFYAYGAWVCPNAEKAALRQIQEDSAEIEQAMKEIEVKYVYRDRIKTVIRKIPSDNCFDNPIPAAAAAGLLDALDTERSPSN